MGKTALHVGSALSVGGVHREAAEGAPKDDVIWDASYAPVLPLASVIEGVAEAVEVPSQGCTPASVAEPRGSLLVEGAETGEMSLVSTL